MKHVGLYLMQAWNRLLSRALPTVHNSLLLAWTRIRPKSWSKLFVFRDGVWLRTVRLSVAYRRLRLHPMYSFESVDRALQDYDTASINRVATCVRFAFSVKSLNRIECLALLAGFNLWIKALQQQTSERRDSK